MPVSRLAVGTTLVVLAVLAGVCASGTDAAARLLANGEGARTQEQLHSVGRGAGRELVAALKRDLRRVAKRHAFSGAVLVAHRQRVLVATAFGHADRATRRRNRVDTRFNLASLGKPLTAVAVAQLVEAGKVRFEDEAGRYVAGLPPRLAGATLSQLLTHTSGLGDFFAHPDYPARAGSLTSLQHYLPFLSDDAVEPSPGDPTFRYSNSGYLLLGLVVEAVSGESYYSYLQREVFARAGMDRSGCFAKRDRVPNLAVGYVGGPRSRAANWRWLPARGTSAGGCYSTVRDLYRFAGALSDGTLVTPAMAETLTTAKVRAANGGAYGYGFMVSTGKGGASIVGHGGGAPGTNSQLVIGREHQKVVVLLSNDDPPAVAPVGQTIARTLSRFGVGG